MRSPPTTGKGVGENARRLKAIDIHYPHIISNNHIISQTLPGRPLAPPQALLELPAQPPYQN